MKEIPGDTEHFIGRKDVLDQVEEAFIVKPFVVIHGMAGIGKSSVATKFAKEHMKQYENMIWVYMNEVPYTEEGGQPLNEICRYISKEFSLNITNIKDDDICSLLQSTFRRLCTAEKQTLIVLDNSEEFLAMQEDQRNSLLIAMKMLIKMATQDMTSKGRIHILCTSRCIADEQYFNNNVKNIRVAPFTLEESGRYLESFWPTICDHKEILHQSSCGYPLILRVFSKALCDFGNVRDIEAFLDQCKKHPGEVAVGSSPYVKGCLIAALKILGDKEMELAKTLSCFEGNFFLYFAKKLCEKVGAEILYLQQLMDKGIISSTKTGFAMHPFLREIINDKVPKDSKLRHKAALTVVYIRGLLKLGEKSFEKDNLSSSVKEFHDMISPFNHLIRILHSYSIGEKELVRSMIDEDVLTEQEPCSFYLLLRFLYPLVEGSKIKSIFEFLREASNEQNTRSMICACLDELDWIIPDCQVLNENLKTYELVMLRRRQLSERVTELRDRTFSPEKDATYNTLREELARLLEIVEGLENKKIRTYYIIKVSKLLGKAASYVNDQNAAIQYFKSASDLSDNTFGATFWTVDIYNCLAEYQVEIGENESALNLFEKAFFIAKNTGLIDLPLICTLWWAYSKFCLKHEHLKEKAIEPLKNITEISYHHNNFQFFSKALGTLCNNFTQYSQELAKNIGSLVIPDEVMIKVVDNVSKHRLRITGRSTEKEIIQRETMLAIHILESAISTARHRLEYDLGDTELLEKAIFEWNKSIALFSAHVMLESDRRPYADNALKIAEKMKLDRKDGVHLLTLVSKSNNSKEDEEMILEVTFLEKTNKIARTGNHTEQRERIIKALGNCQLGWLKLKLFTCLLELTSGDHKEAIGLMNEIANCLSDDIYSPLKPCYVIYSAIQNIDLAEFSDGEKLQLAYVLQQCIRKFDGQLQKEKDMKCKFQIHYITLLRKSSGIADPVTIKSLMQTVLEYGNKRKLKDVKKVQKEYHQYIQDHTSFLSRIWNAARELMIF